MTQSAPKPAPKSAPGPDARSKPVRKPRTKKPAGVEARAAALDLLIQVLDQRRVLELAMDNSAPFKRLEPRDRAFAHNLCATTLRRLGQIDDLIGKCLDKPLKRNVGNGMHLLRLGVAQMMFLGTPAHAAVGTVVHLATKQAAHHKKLINAILRRMDREGAAWRDAQNGPRLNTPNWLWTSWVDAYGDNTAQAIAAAQGVEAALDISAKADPEKWAETLNAQLLPTGSLRLAGSGDGPITAMQGFAEGDWWVQDAAAALPARLLGDVAGLRVLDLCAAPGGKTAQLAAAGAQVTALDRSEPRLKRLRENMDRLGFTVTTVCADAATWIPDEPFDAVLLDAPCSATGTLRRHPDIAHLKSPREVTKLAGVQDRLLGALDQLVRPGGTAVFCTCSVQPEESEDRVNAFLAANTGWQRKAIAAEELGADEGVTGALVTDAGDLRTLPCHWADIGGLDGFFAARLVRG